MQKSKISTKSKIDNCKPTKSYSSEQACDGCSTTKPTKSELKQDTKKTTKKSTKKSK